MIHYKVVYVYSVVARQKLDKYLEQLKLAIPNFDYEPDWQTADTRCEYCIANEVENCRHEGM
jgi:hypothetical protein